MTKVTKLIPRRRDGIGGFYFSVMSKEQQRKRRAELLAAGLSVELVNSLCSAVGKRR